MDNTLKQHILGLALAGAERNRLVFREEHELIAGDPVARYRTVKRPVREVEIDLTPSPHLYRCDCSRIPVREPWEALSPVKNWPEPVELHHGLWATELGPDFKPRDYLKVSLGHYHVWLGQCQECRTIWWRIQEA